MRLFPLVAGAATSLLCSTAVTAATSEELAARFGAREFVSDIGLSPQGRQLVIVAPRREGGETAVVVDLETEVSTPILSSDGGEQQIGYCEFILESRVICTLFLSRGSKRDIDKATRLVSLSADGKEMKQLSARTTGKALFHSNSGGRIIDYNVPGDPDSVLIERWISPESRTGNYTSRSDEGLAVEKVNVVDLSRKPVESPKKTATGFISDGRGNIRLMVTQQTESQGLYGKTSVNFSYRPAEGPWKPLSTVSYDGSLWRGFQPVAVDGDADVAYGFDTQGNYKALYKMPLDGSGEKVLVLGRDDADVDGLLKIGRNQRVIGASYATEKRVVEYFDPELRVLAGDLAKALGKGVQIDVVDASADESKLLILAGSDTQPGKLYMYDKATRKLGFLLAARPELAGMQFGEMKPITYTAADGTAIPGYLTLPPGSDGKNLPAIVMPHGGPESRDEWGFDWLVQFFVARGFAVLQPNFRGSAGYGAQWLQQNGFKSWETAIGDVNDAGRWLEAQGIAAPGKLAIFGWSYGGYAALQSQVVDPDLFKAVVAVAPVTDFDNLRADSIEDFDHRLIDSRIGQGPHVEAGSPARHAYRFKAPVLLVHGDTDVNVRVTQSHLMKSRLEKARKQVRYIEFKGLDHYLSDAAARTKLLVESERTIRQGLGLD